jgi:VWFA-related protein
MYPVSSLAKSLGVCVLAPVILAAQIEEVRVSSRPYTPFHLKAESNLVQVNAIVRDRTGHAVGGLKQTDFKLLEEGKPREIVSFTVDTRDSKSVSEAAAPGASSAVAVAPKPLRFIALYFDDVSTPSSDLLFTKNAAKKFVQESLSPNDRVAVVTSSEGRITKDYSNDRAQLADAIDRVHAHGRFAQVDTAACPRITPYDAYKITVLMDEDAIHSAISEASICGLGLPSSAPPRPRLPGRVDRNSAQRGAILTQAEQIWDQIRVISQNTLAAISAAVGELYRMPGPRTPGSRILLLVSSGFLTGTLEHERDLVVEQALRAGVVINSLDAKGLFAETPGRPFGEDPGTTGTPIEVYVQETLNATDRLEEPSSVLSNFAASTGGLYFHHNNGFSEGFRELAAVPEATYILGFRPEESTLDSKYHKLKVQVTSGSYGVQARVGYYALKPVEDVAQAELDKQVMGIAAVNDLSAKVEYQPGAKNSAGITPLKILMHVDLKGLEFPERNGRRMQKLMFVFAVLDKEKSIVAARQGEMEFALTDARFETLARDGVNAILTLEVPAGTYLLRAVAEEGVKSKIAALSYAIKIP